MRLNNKNVNISEIAGNLPRELGRFQASEGNALRLLFQGATDARTAAQKSETLTNRLRAMGYDQLAVRFDSSGISIIDGRPLEVALDAWVTQEGGLAENAAREIRNTFYKNTKNLYLRNFSLRTLPPILHLLDLIRLHLSGNQLTAFDARGLVNLTTLNLTGNQLTTFDARELVNLTTLNLTGNQLTTFDAMGLVSLIHLDLRGNQLTTFDARELANLTYLSLSGNRLTTFDPMGLANLIRLHLSGNQLTAFDATRLANLASLDLSGNRLTTFDALRLANLTYLSLSGNQLTAFDATKLANLARLNLSGNQLTAFDATQLANLATLSLSGNQLTAFDATQLANLASLDLSGNQLTAFDATQLANLASLDLSGNRLTAFDATQLANLASLDLSGNRLTTFDATELTNLTYLDLADNAQLSNLPLALCQCTNLTRINRFGTQIPDLYCDAILAQCQALRAASPTLIFLPIRLHTWISASGETFKLGFILKEMTDEEKGVINEWLARLERTNDFTTNSQPALAKEVCSMLRDLELHPVFREGFFAQVPANNEACGDRAGMAFNELFVSWKLGTLPQNATQKEKLQIIVAVAKTTALRKALQWIISTYGDNEEESVEIYLYYEKELKEPLQLLTAINSMLYPRIGRRAWIKEEELVAMVNSTYIDELCELPQLKELALKDPEFAKQYDAMNENFTDMLENLREEINSKKYWVGSEEISRRRAENERVLLREWVARLI